MHIYCRPQRCVCARARACVKVTTHKRTPSLAPTLSPALPIPIPSLSLPLPSSPSPFSSPSPSPNCSLSLSVSLSLSLSSLEHKRIFKICPHI